MQSSTPRVNLSGGSRFRRAALRSVLVSLSLLASAPLMAVAQQEIPPGANLRPWEAPDAIRLPDKNDQMEMQQQERQKKAVDYAAANLERKRQIMADTAKLVELANELRDQVAKTNKDTLSLDVIRKADMIEKLAKAVKEKMKLTARGS